MVQSESGPRHVAVSSICVATPSRILVLIAFVLAGAFADRPRLRAYCARLHRPARIAVLRGGESIRGGGGAAMTAERDEDSSPPPPPSAKGAKPTLKRQNGMKDLLSGGDAKADAISSDGDAETVEEVPARPPQSRSGTLSFR